MIPDFQTLMLPFMQHIADGQEHSTTEIHDFLAWQFKLTEEEINQRLPNRPFRVFHNRLSWTKAHLKMAGLLESTKRGHCCITERGKSVVTGNPTAINLKFLKQFPGYLENAGRKKTDEKSNNAETDSDTESNATPTEILANTYLKIRNNLALEILSKIKSNTPAFFEKLVVELLVKMGYGGTVEEAGKSIGRTGDEGIDGIIKEDRLGLDIIYIQAKRWEGVVGRPELHKFVGALAGQGAKKGVFITTSAFTSEARNYQPKNETKIVLVDGEQLANLMIDYDLAVATVDTFAIKRIDNDYFDEE
jgi:restriction system protein